MRKRTLCLIVLLFCMLFGSLANAEKGQTTRADDERLINGVAKQEEAKINFVRYFVDNNLYLEFQHVVRKNQDYIVFHMQGWNNYVDFNQVEIKTDTGNGFTLQASEIKPAIHAPEDCIDKWYRVDQLDDWEKLMAAKKVTGILHRVDGKSYTFNLNTLISAVDKVKASPQNMPVTYGPMYSVFFPGRSYKEVKDTFAYHINERDQRNRPIAINGFWRYCVNEAGRAIGFGYDYTPQHISYVKFIETPKGTWLNLDLWTAMPTNDIYLEWYDRTAIDDLTRKIDSTYRALNSSSYYGITLKGTSLKSPLLIDEVDVKSHPELANVKSGDQIIAVNDKDTKEFARYQMEYIMSYSKGNRDLKLTLSNKKQGIYEIVVKAKPVEPFTDHVNYEEVNKKEDYLWYKKRSALVYTSNHYAPYEIFDPYGPQDVSLESPRTMSLLEINQ